MQRETAILISTVIDNYKFSKKILSQQITLLSKYHKYNVLNMKCPLPAHVLNACLPGQWHYFGQWQKLQEQGSYWEHEHESHTFSLVPSFLSASWLPRGAVALPDIPIVTMTGITTGPESREPANLRLELLKPWAEINPFPLAHARDFVIVNKSLTDTHSYDNAAISQKSKAWNMKCKQSRGNQYAFSPQQPRGFLTPVS